MHLFAAVSDLTFGLTYVNSYVLALQVYYIQHPALAALLYAPLIFRKIS